jgi:hypothetical protein
MKGYHHMSSKQVFLKLTIDQIKELEKIAAMRMIEENKKFTIQDLIIEVINKEYFQCINQN